MSRTDSRPRGRRRPRVDRRPADGRPRASPASPTRSAGAARSSSSTPRATERPTRPRRRFPGVRVLRRPPGRSPPNSGATAWWRPTPARRLLDGPDGPGAGWLDALLARLDATGAAGVGGPIEAAPGLSATDRALTCSDTRATPAAAGSRPIEPPGDNALYRRDRLAGLEEAWADGFWEVEVHRALRDRGESLASAAGAGVTFRGGLDLRRRCSASGSRTRRRYGGGPIGGARDATRLGSAAAPAVPAVCSARVARRCAARGEPSGPGWRRLPSCLAACRPGRLGEASATWRRRGAGPRRRPGNVRARFRTDRWAMDRRSRRTAWTTTDRRLGFLVVGAGFLGRRRGRRGGGDGRAPARRRHRRRRATRPDAVAARHGARRRARSRRGARAGRASTPSSSPRRTPTTPRRSRRSLEAGKHVLCEKPLAIDADDARRLALQADESRLRLATGFNHRFYPPVRDALAWSARGRSAGSRASGPQIGHRASPEFLEAGTPTSRVSGGGTLMDNGPHACDLIRRFLGEVVAGQGVSSARTSGLPSGCESEAFAPLPGPRRGVGRGPFELDPADRLPDDRGPRDRRLAPGRDRPLAAHRPLADGRRDRPTLPGRARRRAASTGSGSAASGRSSGSSRRSPRAPRSQPDAGATGWDGCRVTEMIEASTSPTGPATRSASSPCWSTCPRAADAAGDAATGSLDDEPGGLPVLTYHAIDDRRRRHLDRPRLVRRDARRRSREAGFAGVDLATGSRGAGPTSSAGSPSPSTTASARSSGVADPRPRTGPGDGLPRDRPDRPDNAWPGQPRGIPGPACSAGRSSSAWPGWASGSARTALTHAGSTASRPATSKRELRGVARPIEDLAGRPCRLLAYPYGASGRAVRSAAARHFARRSAPGWPTPPGRTTPSTSPGSTPTTSARRRCARPPGSPVDWRGRLAVRRAAPSGPGLGRRGR